MKIEQVIRNSNVEDKDKLVKFYNLYFNAINKLISSIDLKKEYTESEFDALKHNFNLKGLGKLNVTYKRYNNINKKYNKLNVKD